jgi:hypothetical protein
VTQWRSKAPPRHRRLTNRAEKETPRWGVSPAKAEALIAAVCLAGTNTRRVKRALCSLFEGTVGKGGHTRRCHARHRA